MTYNIKQITQEQALEILATGFETGEYTPLGKFWHVSDYKFDAVYVGIDNSDGHAWTEEFDDVAKCLAWLRGEYELDEKGEMI